MVFRKLFGLGKKEQADEVAPAPRRPEATERLVSEGAAEARHVIESDDGRHLTEEGVDAFPPPLHTLVRALRRLPHRDAVNLTLACKKLLEPIRLLDPGVSDELRTVVLELGKIGPFDTVREEVLRLLRTERPRDGYNIRESLPNEPQSFPASHELTIRVKRGDKEHVFSVVPAEGATLVRSAHGQKTIGRNGTVTLGRAALDLQDNPVFGRTMVRDRGVPCDVPLGRDDKYMPRACIRVVRSGDQIRIFECGATNVTSVEVDEFEAAASARQAAAAPRRLVSRTRLDVGHGESQMLSPEQVRQALGGLGGVGDNPRPIA